MMSSRYELEKNIERMEETVRCESLFEQREITVQTYRTTQPFEVERLESGVQESWLSPAMRLGVFSRGASSGQAEPPPNEARPAAGRAGSSDDPEEDERTNERESVVAVLGLLDSMTLRAYDYDKRKPLWFRWRDLVVETMHVRYSSRGGLLRYTTSGGGRRISEKKLTEFNRAHMGIRDTDVVKEQFSPEKLRELSFGRFLERLYSVRFSGQKGEEYRSIDHAAFRSREYIDPGAVRMGEIIKEKELRVEEFESDIEIGSRDLDRPVRVRFSVRASGSVRMQFPAAMSFRETCGTAAEQAEAFYGLVDLVMEGIFEGKDFFAHDGDRLEELASELDVIPGLEHADKFERVMANEEERGRFFKTLRVAMPDGEWRPHVHALDKLSVADGVARSVRRCTESLVMRAPASAAWLLDGCRTDMQAVRVGEAVADGLLKGLNVAPSESRGTLDAALLAWYLERVDAGLWSVDPQSGRIAVGEWRMEYEEVGQAKARVLGNLVASVHARLMGTQQIGSHLFLEFAWCVNKARALGADAPDCPTGVRMLSDGQDRLCTGDGSRVLAQPVDSTEELDHQVWREFRLPLWPVLRAVRKPDGRTVVVNEGIGTALGLRVVETGELPLMGGRSGVDLPPGGETAVIDAAGRVTVVFDKFNKTFQLALDVELEGGSDAEAGGLDGVLRPIGDWDEVVLSGETIGLRNREKGKEFLRYLWLQGATRASTAVDVSERFAKPSSLFGAGERVEKDRGGSHGRDASVRSELGARINQVYREGVGLVPPPKKGQGPSRYYLKVYRDSATT